MGPTAKSSGAPIHARPERMSKILMGTMCKSEPPITQKIIPPTAIGVYHRESMIPLMLSGSSVTEGATKLWNVSKAKFD